MRALYRPGARPRAAVGVAVATLAFGWFTTALTLRSLRQRYEDAQATIHDVFTGKTVVLQRRQADAESTAR